MRERTLGGGLSVSIGCLGTMNFGADRCTAGEARQIIDAFLDTGHRLIDTADVYTGGEAERIVGAAIKSRREDVLLATKGGSTAGLSQRALADALEGSLRRLAVDHVDLYQCHVPDPDTPLEETMDALDEFVRSGKVRFVGCSNFSAEEIAAAQGLARDRATTALVSMQAHYSLAARDTEAVVLPTCAAHGLGVLAYAPLAGGVLTGRYRAGHEPPTGSRIAYLNAMDNPLARRWGEAYLTERNFAIAAEVDAIADEVGVAPAMVALSWLAGRPNVTSVIIGPRTVEQAVTNLAGLMYELPAEQGQRLDDISAPTHDSNATGPGAR